MFRYIVRRILQAIPTLLGVSILSYLLVLAAPGDPIDMMIGFDPKIPAETKTMMREQLGLDQPALVQYFTWMTGVVVRRGDQVARLTTPNNRCGYIPAVDVTACDNGGGILRGNLGVSYKTKQPVWDRLVERMPATIELGLISLILSLIIGIPLGVLSAVYRGGPFDYAVRFMTVVFTSIPIFWFALLLILVFSVSLGWLPSGGRESVTLTKQFNLWDRIQHLILPAIVLAVGGITVFSRLMRTETLEVLSTDYIRTARAKGLPNRSVWFVHAFRNSLIPLMTVLGPAIVGILAGAVVVETIFAWPGMGRLNVNAAFQQDYPMVLGAGLLFALLTIIGNLLSDIFYAWVDPRVRLE